MEWFFFRFFTCSYIFASLYDVLLARVLTHRDHFISFLCFLFVCTFLPLRDHLRVRKRKWGYPPAGAGANRQMYTLLAPSLKQRRWRIFPSALRAVYPPTHEWTTLPKQVNQLREHLRGGGMPFLPGQLDWKYTSLHLPRAHIYVYVCVHMCGVSSPFLLLPFMRTVRRSLAFRKWVQFSATQRCTLFA